MSKYFVCQTFKEHTRKSMFKFSIDAVITQNKVTKKTLIENNITEERKEYFSYLILFLIIIGFVSSSISAVMFLVSVDKF